MISLSPSLCQDVAVIGQGRQMWYNERGHLVAAGALDRVSDLSFHEAYDSVQCCKVGFRVQQ